MRILVVCLGNICRSPIAEGLFQREIDRKELPWEIDSAGTGSWHIGEAPDHRSIDICRKHDLDISHQRARQLRIEDFNQFDILIAMDDSNYRDLVNKSPDGTKGKIRRMMEFVDKSQHSEVPDPYYDGRFREVYEMLEHAVDRCIEQLLIHKE